MGNISEYLKTCAKNVPGNRASVYIQQVRYANSLTVSATGGKITALTVSSAAPLGQTGKFVKVQADLDGVKFTNEGSGKTSYRETQALEMILSKKSANLIKLKSELADSMPCGVMAIRVDGNGQAWLSGWNEATKDGKDRPFNELETSFDSGAEPGEENGNRTTVTLRRNAGYDELPFGAVLNGEIVRQSQASAAGAFIKF